MKVYHNTSKIAERRCRMFSGPSHGSHQARETRRPTETATLAPFCNALASSDGARIQMLRYSPEGGITGIALGTHAQARPSEANGSSISNSDPFGSDFTRCNVPP